MSPRLTITTFGSLTITIDDAPIKPLASSKAAALVVYLASKRRALPREQLADLLWDDRTQKQAMGNLRVVLASLRKTLGDFVTITRTTAAINQDATVELDAQLLEQALAGEISAETLPTITAALNAYHGDFLGGFHLREASQFETWQTHERERLHHIALDGLHQLVDYHLASGDYASGIHHANRLLQFDPLMESAHRQMMALLAHSGQRQQALAHYEQVHQLLWDELGVSPASATIALLEQIEDDEFEEHAGADLQLDNSIEPPRFQAPFQAIRSLPYFIGRTQEIKRLLTWLRQPQRAPCVIQGMGGVGKSSLAAHIAYQTRADFPDGVLWAKVNQSDTMAILHSFAAAYGRDVSIYGDLQTRGQVVREILADKQVLIVLDDVPDDDSLDILLPPTTDRCAVLVTTRRNDLSLMLGAHWLRLRSFSAESPESLTLFKEILGAVRAAKEGKLQELADLLGHLPLALAIAAGRLVSDPSMTVQSLLDYLNDGQGRVSELAFGRENLTRTFDLSFDWLSAEEQSLFLSLGAFSNDDIIVDAVAQINDLTPQQTNEKLQKLYRLSMLRVGNIGRFRLHPLLYDYANSRNGNASTLHNKMVEAMIANLIDNQFDYKHIASILNQIRFALTQADKLGMHEQFTQGVKHLFRYLSDTGQLDLADNYIENIANLALFNQNEYDEAWTLWSSGVIQKSRGETDIAYKHFSSALIQLENKQPSPLRCDILAELAKIATERAEYDQSVGLLERGIKEAEEISYVPGVCYQLIRLATVERVQGNLKAATSYCNQALPLARQLGQNNLLSLVMTASGIIAIMGGRYERGERFFLQSLKLANEMGSLENSCGYMMNLGTLYQSRGRLKDAKSMAEQALSTAKAIGHRELKSYALMTLGTISMSSGDLTSSLNYLEKSLTIAEEINTIAAKMSAIWHLSRAYIQSGKYQLAIKLLELGTNECRAANLSYELAQQLHELCELHIIEGQYAQAEVVANEGLKIAVDVGLPVESCALMISLATIARRKGDVALATEQLDQAEEIVKAVDDTSIQGSLLLEKGEVALATHNSEGAQIAFEAAEIFAEKFSQYRVLAAAYFGLARTLLQRGELEKGIAFGRKSHTMYAKSGYARAATVADWLQFNA